MPSGIPGLGVVGAYVKLLLEVEDDRPHNDMTGNTIMKLYKRLTHSGLVRTEERQKYNANDIAEYNDNIFSLMLLAINMHRAKSWNLSKQADYKLTYLHTYFVEKQAYC